MLKGMNNQIQIRLTLNSKMSFEPFFNQSKQKKKWKTILYLTICIINERTKYKEEINACEQTENDLANNIQI